MSGTDTDSELLERASELRRAESLLSAAPASRGSSLLIEGPAGIGKSALIRAVRERAQADGFKVLSARGAELERDFSFGVVRQLFEPALSGAAPGERAALLAGAAGLSEPAIGAPGATPPPPPPAAPPPPDPPLPGLSRRSCLTAP